MRLEYLTMI